MFGSVIERRGQQADGRSPLFEACAGGDSSEDEGASECGLPSNAVTYSSRPEAVPRLDLTRTKLFRRPPARCAAGVPGARAQEASVWMFPCMAERASDGNNAALHPDGRQGRKPSSKRTCDWRNCENGLICEEDEDNINTIDHCIGRSCHADSPEPSGARFTMEEYLGLTGMGKVAPGDSGRREKPKRVREMCV
mmetsp:Transcript_96606/g.270438  ORF Transcript_96606/g.270438 Transcript_96606/m.270438 type:complete len:194 (+) Transcript_96606:84-665(+)